MEENQKEEKKPKEDAVKDTDEGDKPEVYKPIDDANLAAKRMEEANKVKAELLNREEDIIAKRTLGGKSEGSTQEVKKEETDKEYKDRVMSGKFNG